ncbi:MAG: carboxymuconolactone decarboxylase family protein [Haloechinothrix sp.]
MIARKTREGCAPCADAYVDLARRFGATDEQIAQALGQAVSLPPATPTARGQGRGDGRFASG